jgi:uncharacterized membrane protein YqjE
LSEREDPFMGADLGEDRPTAAGLLQSVSRLSGTVLGIVHTRLELLRTELQEEVHLTAKVAVWGFIAAFAGLMALFLGALAVIFVFWDSHRILAALAMVALFALIAIGAALVAQHKLKTKPPMLDATLAELAKDRDQLRARL